MGVDPYRGDAAPDLDPFTLFRFRFVNMQEMMRRGAALEARGELRGRMILSSREYLSSLLPDPFLALRYDDVLLHPRETLRERVTFINPSLVDDACLDSDAHIARANPSRLSSLDKEARRRLTDGCVPGLEALGYEARGTCQKGGKVKSIDPVLVLSTGRCGSTMISDVLNLHPDILSLSEVFSLLGPLALFGKRLSGKAMWALCSRQNPALRVLLSAGTVPSEILYPFDDPQARYSTHNVPPILCATLPHLTPDHESLYDELEPVVRARPRVNLADQYRHLFEWLRQHFERRVWVERSGGSLLSVPRLRRLFPEARVVHVYRDGRDTALSMSRHPAFQLTLATLDKLQRLGMRPFENTAEAGPVSSLLAVIFLRLVNPARIIRREFDLAAYGGLWSQMILRGQKLLAALPPERFLALRYEDVVRNPHEKLRELIAFIDPSLSNDAWLQEAARIPRPNPLKYLSLDAETRRRLTEACAPGLEALGYIA